MSLRRCVQEGGARLQEDVSTKGSSYLRYEDQDWIGEVVATKCNREGLCLRSSVVLR